MKKIFKYEINFTDLPTVELPVGAEILTVDKQGDSMESIFHGQAHKLFILAIVEEDEKQMETRKFRIAGTGRPLGEDFEHVKKYSKLEYINTVFIFNGMQVYHIFEIK